MNVTFTFILPNFLFALQGIQMTAVGANQWRGGYKKYSRQNGKNIGSYEPINLEPDSYLGEKMTIKLKYKVGYQQSSNYAKLNGQPSELFKIAN